MHKEKMQEKEKMFKDLKNELQFYKSKIFESYE